MARSALDPVTIGAPRTPPNGWLADAVALDLPGIPVPARRFLMVQALRIIGATVVILRFLSPLPSLTYKRAPKALKKMGKQAGMFGDG